MEREINYFAYDINFTLPHASEIKQWVSDTVAQYQVNISAINYIFCSDEYLLSLNRKYLQHDYLTDILTFPYETTDFGIMADIYISLDRVKENASSYDEPWEHELHRVMIHGVLHLLGFNDHTESQQLEMRKQEHQALANLSKRIP